MKKIKKTKDKRQKTKKMWLKKQRKEGEWPFGEV